jgi:polyhydroxyalkanoate synthesis repressor PhaR
MTGRATHDDGTVLVKKYGNRRLYDTRESRYITLDELARTVQGGATVKVVDAANGKNLTKQVLTQVILEQQDALDMLPVELLHLIVRTQGTLEQAPFAAFLAAFTRQIVVAGQVWTQPVADLLRGITGTARKPTAKPPQPEPPPEEESGTPDAAVPPEPSEPEPPADAPPDEPATAEPAAPAAGLRSRIDDLLRRIGKR